jgi:hypothetical protein
VQRTLEIVFRHPFQLLLLLVLLPVIGFGIAYSLPRSYQSQASLFAIQRYVIIGATGAESDLLATEAQTQATALSELLQTRYFALQVAYQTSLSKTESPAIQADKQALDDALYQEISTHVVVAPQGDHVYTILYTNRDAVVAQQVVQAVIDEFAKESATFSVEAGQKLLQGYQAELASDQQAANAAVAAEEAYKAAHPSLSPSDLINDPRYNYLHQATAQAEATLGNLENEIATVTQEVSVLNTGGNTLFTVVDNPVVPDRAVSRTKTLAIGGGGGLVVALLMCVLYLALLMRRDRAIYGSVDAQRATGVPVILEIPALSHTTANLSVRLLQSGDPPTDRRRRR